MAAKMNEGRGMSPYEKLLEGCGDHAWASAYAWSHAHGDDLKFHYREIFRAALGHVFRTLETVTPEMLEAASPHPHTQTIARAIWLAMLPASPLAPPKDDEP